MAKSIRWYVGYKSKKNPQELIKEISRKVQENDLSVYIPLLRLEKGAKPRKEYYFFMAIESQNRGFIPAKIEDSNLFKLPFFKTTAVPGNRNSFDYDQIKPMVGRSHQVEDFVTIIPYSSTDEVIDDPFDLDISSSVNSNAIDNQKYQNLIYWLSGVGNGSYELFKKTCQTLKLDEPRRILRRLKLLGNLETSPNGKNWSITPTALVQVNSPDTNLEFFLCGQQSGQLLREIEQYATLSFIDQPKGDAPQCLHLQFNNSEDIFSLTTTVKENLGLTIHSVGNVAINLANILPSLEEWKQQIPVLQGIVPSLYDWKRFDGNKFVEYVSPQETGMYQMWNREGCSTLTSDRPRMTLFYDANEKTWRQGDWYGLRFLALHYSQHNCIARYDTATSCLAILHSQRWPELYERALVLASGKLPTIYQKNDQNLWLIYEKISMELAEQLTKKLDIILEEGSDRCTM
ncbi:MAG: hypothetical protein WBB43_01705 [Limnoraphis sp.]